jgi:hypothetical protein
MAKKKELTNAEQQETDRQLGEAARLKAEITLYEREADPWKMRSKKIIKRYKDERSNANDTRNRFNILWSNIQTLSPALFAKNPIVNVERRFQSDDDIGRFASLALERCTSYFVDDKYFDCMKEIIIDRLLPGRGTAWVRYVPKFENDNDIGDGQVDETEEQVTNLYSEEIIFDYVNWQDFGCQWGRTWEEVNIVWRRVYMSREALVKRFGEKIGKSIPLDHSPEKLNDEKIRDSVKKATIYELWDKLNKKAYWIHKDIPAPLDELDDPLNLKEFFPCPRPLFSTLANDSIIPVPDYSEYQDQAEELDSITARVELLTRAVKVAGVYAADAEGIQRILSEGLENRLVPVDQWAVFAEKGGLKGIIEYLPLKEIVEAIGALYKIREEVKKDLYEISGLSDIIRGQGDANETATGVQTKGQFATLRLSAQQGDVARFNRDMVRIAAEIISEHFSPETVEKLSGIQLLHAQEKQLLQQYMQMQAQQPPQPGMPPIQLPQLPPELQKLVNDPEKLAESMDNPTWEEVHELLSNDTMRCFHIDIEVDSTIKMDQDKERQDRIEFLTAAGGFLQQASTVQDPALQPLLWNMLMFGIRGFHVGRELESSFRVAEKKIEKESENPTPKPDPEVQIEMMKIQSQEKISQQTIAHEQAIADRQAGVEQVKAQYDAQIEQLKASHERDIEDMKLQSSQIDLQEKRALEYAKLHSNEKMTRATLMATKSDGETAADAHGLAPDDGEVNKLDQLQQGQQQIGQAVVGVAQQTNQSLAQQMQIMEKQMQLLTGLAQQGQQTMQGVAAALSGIQEAVAAIKAPKKVLRDEKGRVSGVTSA